MVTITTVDGKQIWYQYMFIWFWTDTFFSICLFIKSKLHSQFCEPRPLIQRWTFSYETRVNLPVFLIITFVLKVAISNNNFIEFLIHVCNLYTVAKELTMIILWLWRSNLYSINWHFELCNRGRRVIRISLLVSHLLNQPISSVNDIGKLTVTLLKIHISRLKMHASKNM